MRFHPTFGALVRWRPTAFLFVAAVLLGLGGPAAAVGPRVRPTAPTFNGGVYTVANRGPVVYVGGAFTTATVSGRTVARQRLAAFDARTGALLSWAPSANDTVRALAVTGNNVYAAGDFHAIAGERRDSLARLDADSGVVGSFRHTVTGTAYALLVANGRLFLSGSFSDIDGERRANLAAFSLTTGRLDDRWRPATDDAVHALAVAGPRIYLGGAFHTVGRVRGTQRLAAVDGVNGTVVRSFLPRPPAQVRALAIDRYGVLAATAGVGGRAISYTPTGVLRWQRVFDGDAVAIATAGGITYVGGHFDRACATAKNGAHGACTDGAKPRLKLAAITATGRLAGWAPRGNGIIGVRVLSINPATGVLSAGGDFTMIDGEGRSRFATFQLHGRPDGQQR